MSLECGIGRWLTKRELLSPNKEAVVDGSRRVTYLELNRRVNRLSRALTTIGLRYGDRVAMLSYNRLEFVEVIMAAAKLGLILVPLNWRLTASELSFMMRDSGAGTLIFDPDLGELAEGVRLETGVECLAVLGDEALDGAWAYETLLAAENDDEPEPGLQPTGDSPHIIMYTAGTTASPRGPS